MRRYILRRLAQLLQVAAALEAVRVIRFHEDQRDALGALRLVGLHHDADQVGRLPVGDERLRAIDDVLVA